MAQNYARKIEALRAIAEHPNTPREESEAALAKIAELMIRHSIDETTLRESMGHAPDEITVDVIEVSDEHGTVLIEAIYPMIKAMGGAAIKTHDGLHVVGTPTMLDNLTVLFTTLNLQMVSASNAAGDEREAELRRQHPDWRKARIADSVDEFVWDFVRGYGAGVAEKITARRGKVIDETPGNALVLQTEEDRVRSAFNRMFPNQQTMRGEKLRNWDARAAGHAAGRNADIGDSRVANGATRTLRS